jgi:ABC-type phosphate/phosphonate transport system permease subunit
VLYGVVPQIIPPNVSFTMYRWAMNMRIYTVTGMSYSGIGLLLQTGRGPAAIPRRRGTDAGDRHRRRLDEYISARSHQRYV